MPQRITVARSSEPNTSRSNTKPMQPMTASEASIRSALRNSLASKITQPRPQSEAASISAPTTAIQARRNACRSPVMMNGDAPGRITFQNIAFSFAPMAPAARSQSWLTERTPDHDGEAEAAHHAVERHRRVMDERAVERQRHQRLRDLAERRQQRRREVAGARGRLVAGAHREDRDAAAQDRAGS